MPAFRAILLLLLLGGLGCFVMYVVTGKPRWRALGISLVKWSVLAALGFFAVLIVQRVIETL